MSGFWSSETMFQRLPSLVEPFNTSRIKHCAYELSLGQEAHITNTSDRSDSTRLTTTLQNDRVLIPPGQFALLLTEEYVKIPDDALGFISIRSGSKLRGLVNVSGFHIDPGYKGKLIFSVFNAATTEIIISRGERMFMLWYCNLDNQTTDLYSGDYQYRDKILDKEIMNLQGPTYNPTSLAERVRILEEWRSSRRRWKDMWQNFSLSLVARIVILILGLAIPFVVGAFFF